jgi:threonyl-tRNA synthetase
LLDSIPFPLKQVDFNLPQRFDITYVDSNSEKKRPIMIHRAVLGSLERFFGVLIEHYAGDFPLWLSPIQARILPVTDAQVTFDYLRIICRFVLYDHS